jgi:hypothetical protein
VGRPVSPFTTLTRAPLESPGLQDLLHKYESKCVEEQDFEEAALAKETAEQLRVQALSEQQLQARQAYLACARQLQQLRATETARLEAFLQQAEAEQQVFTQRLLAQQEEQLATQEDEFMRASFSHLKAEKDRALQHRVCALKHSLGRTITSKNYQLAADLQRKIQRLEKEKGQVPASQLADLKNRHSRMVESAQAEKRGFQAALGAWAERTEADRMAMRDRLEKRFRVMLEELRMAFAVRISQLQARK